MSTIPVEYPATSFQLSSHIALKKTKTARKKDKHCFHRRSHPAKALKPTFLVKQFIFVWDNCCDFQDVLPRDAEFRRTDAAVICPQLS